jgi:DNA modification methylase
LEFCGAFIIFAASMELNKTYLGDCLTLMQDIPDGSIDMILCDLWGFFNHP